MLCYLSCIIIIILSVFFLHLLPPQQAIHPIWNGLTLHIKSIKISSCVTVHVMVYWKWTTSWQSTHNLCVYFSSKNIKNNSNTFDMYMLSDYTFLLSKMMMEKLYFVSESIYERYCIRMIPISEKWVQRVKVFLSSYMYISFSYRENILIIHQ